MGTATVERSIVLKVPAEILGPGSEYDKQRLALRNEYAQVILEAQKITVVDSPEAFEKANSLGRILQAGTKDAETFFKPIKQQIDGFKAPVLAHEKEFANPLDAEKRRLGSLITAYNQEQERIRQEQERAAREDAERAAREEQLQRAIELESAGEPEAAEAVLEEPIMAPVVIQQEAPVRVAGQVGKVTYSATVTDFKALLKAVVEGRAPLQCVVADESFLNGKARLEKDGFSVPGVKLNRTAATHFRS